MNDQELDQKIQEALKLKDSGKSYSDIRNHFQGELSEETISYIIRLVDEFVLEETRIEEEIKKAKFKMYLSLAAFGVSVILLYSFYIKGSLYGALSIIAYLFIGVSLYMAWTGNKEATILKKTEIEIDDSKFRLKRRRKK